MTILVENVVPRSRINVIILVISIYIFLIKYKLTSSCDTGFKSYGWSNKLKTAEIIIYSNRYFLVLNYDLFRLQVFFSENVCESLRKAQHIVFDAVNIVLNL